jgi:hypothetical protein
MILMEVNILVYAHREDTTDQGYTNMAVACQQSAAQPASVLALIGIELEN